MLWLIDSCQNKVSTNQYHVTISRSQVELIKVACFLKLTGDPILLFPLDRGLRVITLRGGEIMCRGKFRCQLTPGALITFLPTYSLHNRVLESP